MKNNVSFHSISDTFQPILNSEKFFQITSSLSQIILLILILSWIVKKISYFKVNNIMSCIKIIDKASVGPHESVVILEVEEKRLMLGVTTTNITHLYTFSSIKDKPIINKTHNTLLHNHSVKNVIKNFSKIFWKKKCFIELSHF